ncbi:MAG: hypothetical protein QM756_19130 [Polyangiaceae bacterium]
MRRLRLLANERFGHDFAEQQISGANKLTVDFYFPDEETVVEIAMSLRNPQSEYERDILKVVLAQEAGHEIRRLVFFSKPGAVARCSHPGLAAFRDWASRSHSLNIEIREFGPNAEHVLDESDPVDAG